MINRIKRAQDLLKKTKLDCLIVNNLRNIRYLSGFSGSSGILLVLEDNVILLTDFRYIEQAQQEVVDYCEIMQHGSNLYDDLKNLTVKYKFIGFETSHMTVENFELMKEKLVNKEWIPVKLDKLRMIKDETEIGYITQAVEIADKTFSQLLPKLDIGMTEMEAAALLEFQLRKNGAERTSFQTIVASGERSALPHGQPTERKFAKGDLVTFDFGAVYKGYCSDMTRTIVFGKANSKQKKIYDIVLSAQLATIENLKGAITGKEADAFARDIITKAGYGERFGHGTGHSLGLAIHEEPRLSPSCDTVLRPGMVVTVEPGIYLPGWGGVRIEDIVVITDGDPQVLTKSTKVLFELT